MCTRYILEGPVLVVTIEGTNLDVRAVREFRQKLEGFDYQGIVLDLGRVEFIDSLGLSMVCSLGAPTAKPCALANTSARLDKVLSQVPSKRLPPRHTGVCDALLAVRQSLAASGSVTVSPLRLHAG